mmetsp:Transcript_16709/g.47733  ORF Transcript_16709/g.47733 Transcript_16709/m.47733 type:complete len:376 (+) Transcript_16709:346-1473(+)
MILTLCTACAAPLPDEPMQCAECATRYCSERCERYDRRRGGHGKICGAVASGGGAEQYHADKKYKEAVAVAVAKCAKDTAGQTCYICYGEGDEDGLVRGCACRGESGIAHISCLAEQARRLVVHAEAEARDLDDDALDAAWKRWCICGLCEQDYHGVVSCALGWACWKTYVGRPETGGQVRQMAMNLLGAGLSEAYHFEDALTVLEAELAMKRRLGSSEQNILVAQTNIALCYYKLGRHQEALDLRREIYARGLALGVPSKDLFIDVLNLSWSMKECGLCAESKSFLREQLPAARRALGADHDTVIQLRWQHADALRLSDGASRDDVVEAVTLLEELSRTTQRIYGTSHPLANDIRNALGWARETLAAFDTSTSK